MITKKERKDVETLARSLYQDVLKVEVKEDPDDESSLFLIVTRGVKLPKLKVDRQTGKIKKGV